MRATIPYIKQKFHAFNHAFFMDTLPMPSIRLCDSGRFLGKISYLSQCDSSTGKMVYSNFVLSINTRADFPEHEVEDTIIHEMIHYYIAYNQWKDNAPHGILFRRIMENINTKAGRHITISHKLHSKEEKEQMIDHRSKWHFVCVVKLKDGRTAIKVVPRIVERICAFHAELPKKFSVSGVEWYFTTDPYFNRFPVSAAMKLYQVDSDELAPYLALSKLCEVTETTVRVGTCS